MSTWMSGASGDGAATGAFGTWRGTPLGIGGTWNDSLDAQTNQWSIQPGAEWGAWTGPMDIAVGAIYKDQGETWAGAAAGLYDSRWISALTAIKKAWGARNQANLYVRFAHEFNGDWTRWSVKGTEIVNFKMAWIRFRALQLKILPGAHLVFCPNDGTSGSLGLDWRLAFPGSSYVDVMGVDSYNQYPWVNTVVDFTSKINTLGNYGAPVGIERHRQFAASVGLPFAVCEWASNASNGDAPVYIQQIQAWFAKSAALTGPGRLLYEIYFNVVNYNNGVFAIHPTSTQPKAASAYASAF